MKEKLTIRDYRGDDYEGLCALWEKTDMDSSRRGDNRETIARTLEMGGILIVISNSSGSIIGSSWMTYDGRRIHLHHFAILPSYQGQGLSKPLLRESLNRIRGRGHQIKLEVHRSNAKAIGIYAKAGFKILGDYLVYIIRSDGEIANF